MNNILNIFKPSQPLVTNTVQSLALVPDRPSLTYNSGELVTGHCIISINGALDISQIEIKLSGKAKVEIPLTQTQKENNHSQGADHKVNNVVKKDSPILKLIYNPATVYNSSLTTGRHDIGFSFLIPPNVPSSLDMQFGSIKYKLKVKVNGHEVKNAQLNLNILSNPAVAPNELLAPISVSNEKTVGLIGGKRVQLKCEIPTTGFVLGSPIPIKCQIVNTSKKFMILKGSLKQEITFRADTQHFRTITNKLTASDGPQIEPRSECTQNLTLQVPINLPIVHNTCALISIKYIASVKLDIPGSFDLYCKMPVLLTNQPMQQPMAYAPPPMHPAMPAMPGMPPMTQAQHQPVPY